MNINPAIFEQQDLVDIFDAIADHVYDAYAEVPFDDLDEKAKAAIVLVGLDGEVNNGGFLQFMENSSGEFFPETLEAAKAIQSQELVEVLEKVANQFPNKNIPLDTTKRQELLEKLCKENDISVPFNQLDAATKAEILSNHDGSYPVEECSFALEETEWTKTWEELDDWYYANYEKVYKDFINYMKK